MSSLLDVLRGLLSATGALPAAFYYHWEINYAHWGQPHRAFLYINRAARLNPNSANIFFHLGSLLMIVGHSQPAIEHFTEAIPLNPQHIDAYSQRGLMYTLIGRGGGGAVRNRSRLYGGANLGTQGEVLVKIKPETGYPCTN